MKKQLPRKTQLTLKKETIRELKLDTTEPIVGASFDVCGGPSFSGCPSCKTT
jgi:hypothetical protein